MARRIALHAFAIGALAACAGVARADDTISSEAYEAAAAHNLDPVEVQGAANSVHTDPWAYVRWLTRPEPIIGTALFIERPPYGLSPYLARVAACESRNFAPDVVYGPTRGRAGEIGLFQLHPRGLLPLFYSRGYTDPWSPVQQAAFATWAFGAGYGRHWTCA